VFLFFVLLFFCSVGGCRHGSVLEVFLFFVVFSWCVLFFVFLEGVATGRSGSAFVSCCCLLFCVVFAVLEGVAMGRCWEYFCVLLFLLFFVVLEGVVMDCFWKYFRCCCLASCCFLFLL